MARKLSSNEMAMRILATGKIQVVNQDTAIFAQIAVNFRRGCKPNGGVEKVVGSAVLSKSEKKDWIVGETRTEERVIVDGVDMPQAFVGQKYGPRYNSPVWMVSKLENADGSRVAFAAEWLDVREV